MQEKPGQKINTLLSVCEARQKKVATVTTLVGSFHELAYL